MRRRMGCQNMMSSGMNGSGSAASSTVSFMGASPPAGATGVAVNTAIMFRFSGAMGSGMEQYMDLHMGDLSGAEMPMTCAWSSDRTPLTCTLNAPLAAHTTLTGANPLRSLARARRPICMNSQGERPGTCWGSVR